MRRRERRERRETEESRAHTFRTKEKKSKVKIEKKFAERKESAKIISTEWDKTAQVWIVRYKEEK